MTTHRFRTLATFALLALSAAPATAATISGSAWYRERVALTENAVFEAKLLDVTQAGAKAVTVANIRIANPGQVPIDFDIPYEPSKIVSRNSYVVRATIHDRGRLIFTSAEQHPVITKGNGTRVSIAMRGVPGESGEKKPERERERPAARLGDLPASFTGLLPCSYCAGIRYHVTLLPGGAFFQRKTILREDRDESVYTIGTWTLSGEGRLTLEGDRDGATSWEAHGRTLKAAAGGELTRTANLATFEPRVELRGTFTYQADAARFRDCRTGLRWPVEMSGEYRALERDYTSRRLAPGAELLVALRGRIAPRPKADGEGTEPTLIVERFLRSMPGEACEGRAPGSGLTENRWRVVAIGGRAVTVASHQSEPWIHLDSRSGRVTGSGGCNRVNGTFEVGGSTLRFSRMASTMMACQGMDTETAFLRALDSVRGYRVSGRTLELLNGAGVTTIRLEEANLR